MDNDDSYSNSNLLGIEASLLLYGIINEYQSVSLYKITVSGRHFCSNGSKPFDPRDNLFTQFSQNGPLCCNWLQLTALQNMKQSI